MADKPGAAAVASRLALVVALAKPRVWPLSRKSLPTWVSSMVVLFVAFLRVFLQRMQSDAFRRAHAKKREGILSTMEVIDRFVREHEDKARAEGQAKDDEDGQELELDCLPEASRIFRLLWDDVHECRTTRYGFEASDPRNRRTEDLLRRLLAMQMRRAIRLTRRSRDPTVQTTSADEGRELGSHWSGEKLEKEIDFAKDTVRKHLGRSFVDAKLLSEAAVLLGEVRSDQRRNLRLLWQLVASEMPGVCLVCSLSALREALCAVFHQIRAWSIPIEAAVRKDQVSTRSWLIWIFCGHLLIDFVDMLQAGYAQRATSCIVQSIRKGVLQAMMQQDYEFFDRNAPGVLQERVNHDAGELGSNLVWKPNSILSKSIAIICNASGARAQCSNKLFLTAVLPLIPVTFCQRMLVKYLAELQTRTKKIGEQTASNTSEVIREVRTVRQFAMERREVAAVVRAGDIKEEMSEWAIVCQRTVNIVLSATVYGGLLATLQMGVKDVGAGRMTVAQLLDVMFKLNFNVVFPLRDLLEELPKVLSMRAPLGRICDLLEANPKIEPTANDEVQLRASRPGELRAVLEACEDVTEGPFSEPRVVVGAAGVPGEAAPAGAQLAALRHGGAESLVHEKSSVDPDALSYPVTVCFSRKVRPRKFHGLIEFENVHFAYPTNPQKPVLKGVSFTVQPGQKVALVGGTGCGKSSIMALLQRLYQPQKGAIKVDGRHIEDYDVHFLRSRMVIVDQLTVLFATTLRDNITYGLDAGEDDKRLEQVCRDACAWDFIEGKPDHLMSEVSAGGKNLSGGERQRVAIARAMIRRPDVILLDEATSALDTKNERIVQEALDKLARQGSALVIAHRLSTVQDSDKIIVVDQGVNMEEGTHQQLLSEPADKEEPLVRQASATPPVSPRRGNCRSREEPGQGLEPGPPLQLKRETSAPPVLSKVAPGANIAGKAASYRSLWESATGSERMTVQQMQKRIDQLEGELSGLRGRVGRIRSFMSRALDGPSPTAAGECLSVPRNPALLSRQSSY